MAGRTTWFFAVLLVATALGATKARASDESAAQTAAPADGSAPSVQIAEHTTTYVSWGRNRRRAHNVELAASNLDGAVVAPGAELSFDERVGPRSADAGFESAPVIASGHMREGMGGGVCQVATTLNVAAMEAGLVIVERRAHSFPSHYVDPGLDATVAEGQVDYRVRNPYPFPIRVRALAANGTLQVSIFGAHEVPEVRIHTTVVRETALPDQVVLDPSLPAGERVVEEPGRRGLVVVVERETDAGTIDTDRVRYAPQARVVRVGTGA